MEKTLVVAKHFNDLYKRDNGEDMDEMRMHKMMYLAQRESLMYKDALLFDADFKGWKFGPVLLVVRSEYCTGNMFKSENESLSEESKNLVESVYKRYSQYNSWKLSSLSHAELSWKNSRKGLKADEAGTKSLKLADMKVDAAKELLKRKRTEAFA